MTFTSSSSTSSMGNANEASAADLPQSSVQKTNDSGISPLQFGLAAVILGASAGLTLYTKKTSHMLNQLERASKNVTQRKGPARFGPKSRSEWEKTRNRWEKDDL